MQRARRRRRSLLVRECGSILSKFIGVTANDCTSYRQYWSIPIDTSWTPGTLINHGRIIDNGTGDAQGSWAQHANKWGGSPEILQSASNPQTGYAKLVAGLYSSYSPLSATYGAGTPDSGRVMHILEITPGDNTISFVDHGARARVGTPSDGGRNSDGGQFAMPDPVGQFTNGTGRYVGMGTSTTGTTGSAARYKVLKDTDGDGTVMDDDADFLSATGMTRFWSEDDMEIYGKRLYGTSGYSGTHGGVDGYFYHERNADNTYSAARVWFATNPNASPLIPATIDPYQTVGDLQNNGGFAAGKITVTGGGTYDATWGGMGPAGNLFLLADFNNDGDAMDNAGVAGTLEYRLVYNDASVTGSANNLGRFNDVELIEQDGKPAFLVVHGLNALTLVVLQLTDSGEFAGTGQATPADYVTVITIPNTLGVSNFLDVELDYGQFMAAAIPEPGTLLLIGTGVLGVLGYARRRRMT